MSTEEYVPKHLKALISAIKKKENERVAQLLQKDPEQSQPSDLDIDQYYGDLTPLLVAAKYNNYDAIEMLINNGASVTKGSAKSGRTAIEFAADGNFTAIVMYLARNSNENNMATKAMFAASENGHIETLNALLAFKEWDMNSLASCLNVAANTAKIDVVEILLATDAKKTINWAPKAGPNKGKNTLYTVVETALANKAIIDNYIPIVKLLVDAGGDANAVAGCGRCAMHLARLSHNTRLEIAIGATAPKSRPNVGLRKVTSGVGGLRSTVSATGRTTAAPSRSRTLAAA